MRRAKGLTVAILAVATAATLAGCAQANGTEALTAEVMAAEAEFSAILEESADTATDALDEAMLTALGRDYRSLGSGVMVTVPRAILQSTIDERDARVTMAFSTNEQTTEGLFGTRSNAFICVAFTGTASPDANVERHDADCDRGVEETYTGWRHYSLDELNFTSAPQLER